MADKGSDPRWNNKHASAPREAIREVVQQTQALDPAETPGTAQFYDATRKRLAYLREMVSFEHVKIKSFDKQRAEHANKIAALGVKILTAEGQAEALRLQVEIDDLDILSDDCRGRISDYRREREDIHALLSLANATLYMMHPPLYSYTSFT